MSTRRPKGSLPIDVLDTLVAECEQSGAPPTATLIGERLGIGSALVSRTLRALLDDGAVSQPHGERGPYVPTRTPDGQRVRLVLVVGDDPPPPTADPLYDLLVQLPTARREEAERYLRFLIEQG